MDNSIVYGVSIKPGNTLYTVKSVNGYPIKKVSMDNVRKFLNLFGDDCKSNINNESFWVESSNNTLFVKNYLCDGIRFPIIHDNYAEQALALLGFRDEKSLITYPTDARKEELYHFTLKSGIWHINDIPVTICLMDNLRAILGLRSDEDDDPFLNAYVKVRFFDDPERCSEILISKDYFENSIVISHPYLFDQFYRLLPPENGPFEIKKDHVEDKTENFDPVSRPSHYTAGRKYEPRKVIYDWGLNFNLGNAVKYISRAGRKNDAAEDLEKAIQYIQFELEEIKEAQNESTN